MTGLTAAQVQALQDELSRAEIRDAMFRYCRGVDRANKDLIMSAFHPDAHDDHGKYHGPTEKFATALVPRVAETTIGLMHTLGNMLVEFDGDVARVETYFQATYRDKAEPEMFVAVGGRYLDRFERRNGLWRIARRTVVNDWSFRQSLPVDVKGMEGYPSSRADSGDLVFLPSTWESLR